MNKICKLVAMNEEHDWLCQDPGELLLEEQGNDQVQGDELLASRLFRKKT